MARGLLVSFAGYPVMFSSLFPDNGLASLASVLLEHDHEVKILDFNSVSILRQMDFSARTTQLDELRVALKDGLTAQGIEDLLEISKAMEKDILRFADVLFEKISFEVRLQNSQFIGFKLWSGDGFLASIYIAEKLSKSFPEIKIYAGGPAVLYAEQEVFSFSSVFDALVDGEGEEAILGLADFIDGKKQLGGIPNLIIKDNGNIRKTDKRFQPDIDQFPIPNYSEEVYPGISENDHIRIFILDESRGCPVGCSFCIHQDASGSKWRVKSPDHIIQELEYLHNNNRSSMFRFGGSNTPSRFFSDFVRRVPELSFRIRFTGFGHPTGIKHRQIEKLAEAGCRSLFFGIESFDPSDSEKLGKKFDIAEAKRSIDLHKQAGILPLLSLIVPAPGQTKEARKTNQNTLLDICQNSEAIAMVMMPGLLPRTEWWKHRSDFGFQLTVPERQYKASLADYKIKQILPPTYWEPLGYRLDGMKYSQYSGITMEFQKNLREQGVVVNAPDEMVMLAELFGMSVGAIQALQRRLFFTMNVPEIEEFVIEANRRIGESC